MIDEPKIQAAIARCLKFPGGRARPDKSYPFLLPLLTKHPGGTILDVGCGRGSAGLILQAAFANKFVLDGIDIHPGYLHRDMRRWYRTVIVGDILKRYREPAYQGYDLYFFMDVLEHLTVADAVTVTAQFAGRIPASLPVAVKYWRQSPAFEARNPHERHQHDWTAVEVTERLGLSCIGEQDGIGVFASLELLEAA